MTLTLTPRNRDGILALVDAARAADDVATAITHLVAAAEAAEADHQPKLARAIRAVIAKWSSR